jgi:hypothetical protein
MNYYEHQKYLQQLYHQTDEWRDKNNFGIFVIVLTIALIVFFS